MPKGERSADLTQRMVASGAVVPGEPIQPPDPPPELGDAEQAIWRGITGKMPPGWFSADNVPMLKELCRHIRHADELAADLEVVREALAAIKERITADPALLEQTLELTKSRINLMRAHGYQSERIGNLSTKLRLTNQSRYEAIKADRERRDVPTMPRPWEDWGLPPKAEAN